MVEEYDSILHNNVSDVVLRPKDKSMVSSHWIYKINQAPDGSVAHGFSQVEGIDYDETFSHVARYS